jgi:hypothetical protein
MKFLQLAARVPVRRSNSTSSDPVDKLLSRLSTFVSIGAGAFAGVLAVVSLSTGPKIEALKTSVEDVKTALKTSVEDVKTSIATLNTSFVTVSAELKKSQEKAFAEFRATQREDIREVRGWIKTQPSPVDPTIKSVGDLPNDSSKKV